MKNLSKISLVLLSIAFLAVSCKKSDVKPSLEDGKSTIITDLAGDTYASVGNGVDGKESRPFYTFLFRFSDKKQIWIKSKADSLQWLKSTDWDLAFTGPYNAEIYGNNGTKEFNPGFGGLGKSKIVVLNKAYADVTEAPKDEDFEKNDINKFGWSQNEDSNGWFYYSLNTHLITPIKNRVYVIKLTNGHYAKLEIISAYQGNPPVVTDINWPVPYYTFRYFVQNDGSKNLNTKN